MKSLPRIMVVLSSCAALAVLGQTPSPDSLSVDQVVGKASPSVALVLVRKAAGEAASTLGAALVVREDGVLLTANTLVKDAHSLQVRFQNGEVFDEVRLLGVDLRRDIAAIKISAVGLPVLPSAAVDQLKPGEPIVVVSHAMALPWSASSGIIGAVRMADEVPGAGSGYRLVQFTAPLSQGSTGGVLMDMRGRAIGLMIGSIGTGQNLNFAVPLSNVIGLANGEPQRTFASGAGLTLTRAPALPPPSSAPAPVAVTVAPKVSPVKQNLDAAEKSDLLNASKDRDTLLRTFKTMYVDAQKAQYFNSAQLKAALGSNKGFAALNIRMVDEAQLADTVLKVSYTFAWDYPFELKHQNTTTVLLAGKGYGPLSGPVGADSVAREFVKMAKPFRLAAGK